MVAQLDSGVSFGFGEIDGMGNAVSDNCPEMISSGLKANFKLKTMNLPEEYAGLKPGLLSVEVVAYSDDYASLRANSRTRSPIPL